MRLYKRFSHRYYLHRSILILTLLLVFLGNVVASGQDSSLPAEDGGGTSTLVYLPLVSGGTQSDGGVENQSHDNLVIPGQYIVVLNDEAARTATGSAEVEAADLFAARV